MTFLEFSPSAALCPFVERLWVLRTRPDAIPDVAPVLPDGHVELIVHLGAPFLEVDGHGHTHRQAPVVLAAQSSEAIRLRTVADALMVGARLRPQAAAALTGVPQSGLTGAIHDMRAVNVRLAARCEAHLFGRTDAAELASAFDEVLVSESRERVIHGGVDRAVHAAQSSRGLLRVDDLSSAARVGPRQLERLFAHHIGLSPKAFLRVLRFQEVLAALQTPVSRRWADLAVSHGFYDQAHFINDFRRFTGESPAAWAIGEESLTAVFASRLRDQLPAGSARDTASRTSC